MATVGQALVAPEAGWKRYDDNVLNLLYLGTWDTGTYASSYLTTFHRTTAIGSSVKIKFYGTKIRILSFGSGSSSSSVNFYVDGVFSSNFTLVGLEINMCLCAEKTGLTLGIHEVELINNSTNGNGFRIDAIDIEDTAYFVHPVLSTQSKTSLANIAVGDYISCEYTATSGVGGTFANLGNASKAEIPLAGTATPNGSFNFICIDRKDGVGGILVADRVVQTGITWDALNAGGFLEGRLNVINIIPTMTSNNAPSGIASTNSMFNFNYDAWYAFNKATSTGWVTASGLATNAWLSYEFPTAKIVNAYTIQATDISSEITSAVKTWTFEGSNDGVAWDVLDTRANVPVWAVSERRYYGFNNSTLYKWYRVNVSANQGGIYKGSIYELEMHSIKPFLIRSIIGGVAYIDANGDNNATANLGLGLFPANNEWDKYITKSNLKGKVTPDDSNVFNHANLDSWCQDTYYSSNTGKMKRHKGGLLSNSINSTSSTSIGFRPVLVYKENGLIW
jgi:hypothetical protein